MANSKVIAVLGATGAQGGGLVKSILEDSTSEFKVRALTRNATSESAKALSDMGAEVVEVDLDNYESLVKSFSGAYGVYAVTFFWEHFSPEKEISQVESIAKAAKETGVEHVVWSTLEDTRKWVSLDDESMPTLNEKYKVPHFDGKGEDGNFTFALPMGEKPLPGIAAEDIGKCAYGVFKAGSKFIGKRIGITGEIITGKAMADALGNSIGKQVNYFPVPFDMYRGFDFQGADDLGNMFQF